MRRLFTTADALAAGATEASLRWGERQGRWRRVIRGVYGEGPQAPTDLDRAVAKVLRTDSVAAGTLAGVLHELDGVILSDPPIRRRALPEERVGVVAGVRCTDALQTRVDLASVLDDEGWEQALESALRKRLTSVSELHGVLPELGRSRSPGTALIRRVLHRRLSGAPPTESLLETLMVQLARNVEGLGEPVRQHEVFDLSGLLVARVDRCWPELGLFLELDGQHHRDQPVYDARRETAVVAAMAWLPGRFTWREVVTLRRTTTRRLAALADQARRRPLPRAS